MKWFVQYRGPLHSCNYACIYCPFAKSTMSRDELLDDECRLQRFVAWVRGRSEKLAILFTPWGEALIHPAYQQALIELSHLPQVWQVAIQTNLSGSVAWLAKADREALGLWTTYHPGQVPQGKFIAKCQQLDALGGRYSVGMVGMREHFSEIQAMRRALPDDIYLWINAYKREVNYYSVADRHWLQSIDPLFHLNAQPHESLGVPCLAGEGAFTVDGEGTMRRCHFVETPIGNIYEHDPASVLKERQCPNLTCRCHIGYMHLPHLKLYDTFGAGLPARIWARSG